MFGKKKVVVKLYHDESALVTLRPDRLATIFLTVGIKGRAKSLEQVVQGDASRMAKKGYRIVSSSNGGNVLFGGRTQTVTYELIR